MTCDLKIMPEQVCPFTFPIFSDEDDPLVRSFHNLIAHYKLLVMFVASRRLSAI